tara:strand:- start:266 stop:574 length:309 start_codon:yes stop_codon:yes gene_type:complete
MSFTRHSEERINMRLRMILGLSKKKINHMKRRIMRAGLKNPFVSQAVKINELNGKVRNAKGRLVDQIWVVIRNNKVVTVMFRDSSQTSLPIDFDVDLVWSMV